MSTHDHDDEQGLTPEERALARRLARLGPNAEPSSALDARILAAAHAATGHADTKREPVRPRRDARRKPARWPTVFGFAASLAVACGIAWQLRPVPEAPTATQRKVEGEEPLAEFVRPPPSPPMQMRTVPPKELKVPEAPPPAQAVRAPQRPAIRAATPEDVREKPRVAEAPMEFVVDEAIHPETAAAAAAPAPMAAQESTAVAADMAAPAPAAPPAPAAAKAAANAHQRAEALARERADAEPAFAEPDEEVVPPATANDPVVRDAWLRRIRELLKTGDEQAARASLHAFRERYPRYVLPDDLRALENRALEE